MYQAYDISSLLKISSPAEETCNLFSMIVAGGWWCGHVGLSGDNCQYGDCLDTGFLSVHLLLDVLAETGHADITYKLLFQTKCPGWLYMVGHGATTIWETRDCVKEDGSVGTCSYNHYAYGCVGKWLYTRLAGISARAPGYKEV